MLELTRTGQHDVVDAAIPFKNKSAVGNPDAGASPASEIKKANVVFGKGTWEPRGGLDGFLGMLVKMESRRAVPCSRPGSTLARACLREAENG